MELITSYICKTFDIGIHNNMFGGTIMCIIDDAAASYAAQICDTPNFVTIKFDGLVFKKPVNIGSILKIYGKVVRFGKSSVELYIEVRKHNVYTGDQSIVTHTNVTMVRVDEDSKSIPISEFVKRRYTIRLKKFNTGLLTPDEMKKESELNLIN
jgi:acyl-CoA thioesterase YciA